MLRLPTIRAKFPDLADQASRKQMSYLTFLAELLLAECDGPGVAPSAGPRPPRSRGQKSVREFDFDPDPSIDPAVIHTLATSEWAKKAQPLCLIGDSGTGKSHLLLALGTEAAMAGCRAKYALATKLVDELVEDAEEKQLSKTIARYGRADLLCIDELGYMELDRHGAELMFQVLTEQEENKAIPSPPTSRSAAGPQPHRPPALHRDRRPAHFQRHDHRDRRRLLPPRSHSQQGRAVSR
ncbi:ATP-binding protein [Streptomyces sp. NPDC001068]|uniref:ATP-binding protein n=1 Tax=Streptomyces sp. NPDC001068 TaxID=3364544 RepID=UPI0036CFF444